MSDFHKLTLRDNDIEDEDAEGCAALLALQSSALEVDKQSSPRRGKRSRNNSFIKDGPRRGRPPSLQFDQLDVFDASCEDYMLQKDPQRPMLTQDLFSLGCSDLTFAMKRQRSTTSRDSNGAASDSSGGSAKDVLYAEQNGPQGFSPCAQIMEDVEEDMEVEVISETEKGCQVWFPPIPGEYERRRNQKMLGRQSPTSQVEQVALAGGAESVDIRRSQSMPFSFGGPNIATGLGSGGGVFGLSHCLSTNDNGTLGSPSDSMPSLQHEMSGNKRRLIWSEELHDRFLAAIKKLGVRNAVPKAILTEMGVEGMTRENVASHLQKYRMHLKMLGTSANLSVDEMMAIHINSDASDASGQRRWNEGDNRPRLNIPDMDHGMKLSNSKQQPLLSPREVSMHPQQAEGLVLLPNQQRGQPLQLWMTSNNGNTSAANTTMEHHHQAPRPVVTGVSPNLNAMLHNGLSMNSISLGSSTTDPATWLSENSHKVSRQQQQQESNGSGEQTHPRTPFEERMTSGSNLSLSLGHGSGTVNMQGVHIQGASSDTGAGNLLGLQRSGGLVMPVLYLKDGTALYAPSAGSVEGPTALLTAAGGMQSQQQHVVLTAGQAMQLLGAAGAAPGSVQWAGGLGL
ncbi:hypothetical protein CEUSTIGMA_g10016.t1 [Chlamydomonas eustigma]|uniref:HTH myb-type domain-containing protein n=1 Tax=Chlamydomonas eustigma TaxID=1157962 RepID=A0A250XIH7_9CHLO|nr:hypothetical protein CEUSTIGMA_g10016.t1 [Chlamydomonas eustigma]|eukprot:GAX82590.1 hypothetical protein CEUSTIGMA_g10016.t1 [Chlamydomonas eustigma]